MKFEFDPDKSQTNQIKHGIDFIDAQQLWNDPELIGLEANSETEPRFFAIGKIGAKYWTMVYTRRNDAIRIISVRRARNKEIQYYES